MWHLNSKLFLSPRTILLSVLGGMTLLATVAWVYIQQTGPKDGVGLSYYIEAHRLDPIFAIAGTNPDKLSVAVADLLSEQASVAKLYGNVQGDQITQSLYPSEFLILLPRLESMRQELLANPSVINVKRYHAQLVDTIDAYHAGASALADALDSLTLPRIGYLGGNVIPKDYAAKMRRIAEAASAQKDKETVRFACFTAGVSASCTSLKALQSARQTALATPKRLPAPSSNVRKADTLASALLKLAPNYYDLSDYLVAFPSHCYTEPITYARAFYARTSVGEPGRKLGIVNNVYFYDLLNNPAPRPSLVDEQLQAGATIQYQNIGNLYECPNSGFDSLELGRVVGVREMINNKSAQTDEERALLKKEILQKADLAPYVAAAATSASPETQELVERYLQGSADFDQIIMGAYSDNRFLITLDKTKYSVEFEFMMMVRNFASTLYLLGNPTFVPKEIDLFNKREVNPLSNLMLRDYRSDLSVVMGEDEILRQFGIANDVVAKYFNAAE